MGKRRKGGKRAGEEAGGGGSERRRSGLDTGEKASEMRADPGQRGAGGPRRQGARATMSRPSALKRALSRGVVKKAPPWAGQTSVLVGAAGRLLPRVWFREAPPPTTV